MTSFLYDFFRHCEGALALCPTLAPHASAGEQSLLQCWRLLRREEHPPRNDGKRGATMILAIAQFVITAGSKEFLPE